MYVQTRLTYLSRQRHFQSTWKLLLWAINLTCSEETWLIHWRVVISLSQLKTTCIFVSVSSTLVDIFAAIFLSPFFWLGHKKMIWIPSTKLWSAQLFFKTGKHLSVSTYLNHLDKIWDVIQRCEGQTTMQRESFQTVSKGSLTGVHMVCVTVVVSNVNHISTKL